MSPTRTFALSCVLIHDRDWLTALDQTIAFRRFMRDQFHISPRAELKATWLVHNKGDVREIAWRYALQRLERFGAGVKDNLHVLPDEGHGDFIRKKIRLMRRFNHVPSAFGGAALGRNAENIVEDSSDRRSKESFFIQLADLNAYAAYRKVFPGATFGGDIWDELGTARVLEVNSLRGGPPGIVVWPA